MVPDIGPELQVCEVQRAFDARTLAAELHRQAPACRVAVDHNLRRLELKRAVRPLERPLGAELIEAGAGDRARAQPFGQLLEVGRADIRLAGDDLHRPAPYKVSAEIGCEQQPLQAHSERQPGVRLGPFGQRQRCVEGDGLAVAHESALRRGDRSRLQRHIGADRTQLGFCPRSRLPDEGCLMDREGFEVQPRQRGKDRMLRRPGRWRHGAGGIGGDLRGIERKNGVVDDEPRTAVDQQLQKGRETRGLVSRFDGDRAALENHARALRQDDGGVECMAVTVGGLHQRRRQRERVTAPEVERDQENRKGKTQCNEGQHRMAPGGGSHRRSVPSTWNSTAGCRLRRVQFGVFATPSVEVRSPTQHVRSREPLTGRILLKRINDILMATLRRALSIRAPQSTFVKIARCISTALPARGCRAGDG